MQHLWAPIHKERWAFPEEEVVVLRKTQLRIFLQARNLRFDSCELTLKPRNGPSRTWRQFWLLAFHKAPHVPNHAKTHPSEKGLAISWL
jgi:hypothetical protein